MAAITLPDAQAQLAAYLAASTAIAAGQSYTIATGAGNTSLTRANLAEVLEMIKFWRGEVERIEREASGGGGIRVRAVTPTDG
ncbi:MAG: DUF6148 family protein [Candidatus Eisenbacteria bacterium]|nr:DUF6148 family protein [Candidatus Eisenbacteria bacterium]